jgi:hypothetical protein
MYLITIQYNMMILRQNKDEEVPSSKHVTVIERVILKETRCIVLARYLIKYRKLR